MGMFALIYRLKKLFKSLNPDIIHVQYLAPGFLPIVAARLAGMETIFATVHQPGRTHGWKAKILLRTAALLCTAFFCNSKSVEESWFGSSMLFSPFEVTRGRRHFTIYNAVDAEYINRVTAAVDILAAKKETGAGKGPIIGVVGRLRSEKGQSIIIEVMPEIIKAVPDAMLMFVGDGPDRECLQALSRQLGVSDHVLWMGQKAHDEAIELLAVMDVVVVPSMFEGFGLAAAEAMAAAKPVVASNVDGLCEIIDDGESGILVPAGDSELLATAIITLLERPELAKSMGQKGYTKVKEKFSLQGFSKAIINAYQVLQKR
jgi:glycosyltransferase involved in cell wall biosynthesis